MAISVGTTANFTWRADGVTVAITPSGGSTTTISVALDKAHRVIEFMTTDDSAGGTGLGKILNAVSRGHRGGFKHIEV